MSPEQKTTYPVIPVKHWWALRNNFRRSIPNAVTPGYIAAALNMQETSAKSNLIPSLMKFGFIDPDGKPLDRAVRWRDNEQYSQVCDEIRREVYPQELLDALPGPSPDRQAVERWFGNKTGVGEPAAKRMAAVYVLLCEADASKGQETPRKVQAKEARAKVKQQITRQSIPTPGSGAKVSGESSAPQTQPGPVTHAAPSLHIDIQIHISPEATADQIEKIFASMAKYLYKGATPDNE